MKTLTKEEVAQKNFEARMRTKSSHQLKLAKDRATEIDWEAAYKTQRAETHEVYEKLNKWSMMYLDERTRNKKLKRNMLVGFIAVFVVIIISSLAN